jgi:short-subunit dehydrogenase
MSRRLPTYQFAGRTAVLTGAASGIGEQLAYGLAARRSHLVLVDVDEPRLTAVVDRIRREAPGVRVEPMVTDLGDRSAVLALTDRILAGHPAIDLLINNAGVAMTGDFDQITVAEFDALMAVNFTAPVLICKALLPALRAAPGSHLVNVSSLFGLVAPGGQTAYSASKFALRGFTQALQNETPRYGVGVTVAYPGGVRTRLLENVRTASGVSTAESRVELAIFGSLLTYPASKAAAQILEAVAKRRARVLISSSAKVPDVRARRVPVPPGRIIAAADARVRRKVLAGM